MEFKDKLKELRKKAGLTQKELAEKSGVSYSYITKLENGIQANPTYEMLEAIGTVLKAPIGAMYDFSDIDADNSGIMPIQRKAFPLLGEIACGKPVYANEERESYIESGTDINADFCLRARGDSMVGARILSGDIVFIKKADTVSNGEIAAVIIDDEATLKRVYYYPEKGKLVLVAENPQYEPLVYVGEELNQIHVLGKAVAFQSDVK